MANKSSYSAGNLNTGNIAYQLAFGSEISTLANGSFAISSVAAFDNTTALDEFMDISVEATIASGFTLTAGASFGFWLLALQGGGSNYGEGSTRLALGGASSTYVPVFPGIGGVQFTAGAVTALAGDLGGIALRPCKFVLGMQNQLVATPSNPPLVSCSVWIRTYNQNLNA
jgi:hypothetical protein